ncbi:inorganic diphosphatase [Nocardia vermiculata]|uniref:inorganic diphosphatase n=1 Tax=Nocardia vermiculata TaxID=257274 RepID=A0A846Y4W0_9NOCA|nr:inorganic diphosphatase [Nocardia vermiculata]NKY52751.1 inorganic pyrophosphatase [Nocardia vermiculata]
MARRYLRRSVELTIDRQYGSLHPVHVFRYEANYGYVPGTTALDGDGLDGYYLGQPEPLATASGVCVAVIHRTGDDDDKLIVIPTGTDVPGDDDIATAVEFQEIPGRYTIIRG